MRFCGWAVARSLPARASRLSVVEELLSDEALFVALDGTMRQLLDIEPLCAHFTRVPRKKSDRTNERNVCPKGRGRGGCPTKLF